MTNSTDEQRYTLAEAQRELARKECRDYGHSWDVISTLAGPERIVCSTCGESHRVARDDA